jgi:hypothetical protein
VAAHESVRRYRLETIERSSRSLGRQTLPVAAVVDRDQGALEMLGRRREAALCAALVAQNPEQFRWFAVLHHLSVLGIGTDWSAVLAVADWLRRQPGLGSMSARSTSRGSTRNSASGTAGRSRASWTTGSRPRLGTRRAFEQAYGSQSRPVRIRFRVLDPANAPVPGLVDVTLPVDELAALTPALRRGVVVENEISMLAFPDLAEGLAIWGSGNQAPELPSAIPWLPDVDLYYRGVIDTHGFAILNRLRGVLPHVWSLLMDRATLLDDPDRWRENETLGAGPHPNSSRWCSRTTAC